MSLIDKQKELSRQAYEELIGLQKPPDDFRLLGIMPTWIDICSDQEPFLRANIVEGKYPDADTYLDIQFRLLREDLFNPLRTSLQAYHNLRKRNIQPRGRVENVRLYYDVRIQGLDLITNKYQLLFSTKGLEHVHWEGSKRFMTGSLLCLSCDNFESLLLFTVADRNGHDLSRGQISVSFEGAALPAHAEKRPFVMVESSVFFEAYRGVLLALQRISPVHFPLEEYMLGKKTSPQQPDYLSERAATVTSNYPKRN